MLTFVFGVASAQSPEYANNTTYSNNANCLDCSVLNPFFAVDADLQSFSELRIDNALPGGEVEQKLIFANNGTIGDSVVLSVQIPEAQGILAFASNVFIETFLGAQSNNDRVRVISQSVGAVPDIDNNFILIFRPVHVYDRISIILSSETAGAAPKFRVKYVAKFIGDTDPIGGACEGPIAQSVEISPECDTCRVDNPTFAVDADEASYSEFVVTLGTGGDYIAQNLQFANSGLPGDTVEVVVEIPNTGPFPNGFGSVTLTTYLDATNNLDSKEFTVLVGNKFTLRIAPSDPFNIVQVRYNVLDGVGLVDQRLFLYYACMNDAGSGNQGPCVGATDQSNVSSGDCIVCSVDNPSFAVDGDMNTASKLNLTLPGTDGFVEQILIFPIISPANDEITLYLRLDSTNTPGPRITVKTGLFSFDNDDERIIIESNTPVSGSGIFEYRFRPISPFNNVKFRISDQVLGASIYIHEACVTNLNPVLPSPGSCDNGISTTTDESDCSFCSVTNELNVIDSDDNSFSKLEVDIAEAGSVSQTVNFGKDACEGDTVLIVIEDDNGGVSLSGFGSVDFIALDNGVETASITIQAGSLSPGIGNRFTYVYVIPSGVSLDAVRLKLNGDPAGLNRGIRWFSACLKTLPPPKVGSQIVDICYGESITLLANANANIDITWFDAPFGGNIVGVGPTFTTPNLTDTSVYYLESKRQGTICASPLRSSSTVNVKPLTPGAFIGDQNYTACFGELIDVIPEPFGGLFNFYADAGLNDLLFTGSFLRINPLVSDTTIYVQRIEWGCPSEDILLVRVTMLPITPTPILSDSIVICIGSDAIVPIENVTATGTYNWYDANFGGNRLFTGDTLMLVGIISDTSFYVEAIDIPCGVALARKYVEIQVVDPPTTSVSSNWLFVCPGDDATLFASPSVPQAYVAWYDVQTGGTPLATGNTYTFTPIDTVTEIYVGSIYDQCEQTSRDLIKVYNQGLLIKGLAYDTTICQGSDIVLQANPLNPNSTITWWTNDVGGTNLGSGTVYEAENVVQNTVFYVQIDIPGCNSFDRVPIAVNTVSALNLTLAEDTIYFCSSDFNSGNVTFVVNGVVPGTNVSWFNNSINGLQLADSVNSYTLTGVIKDTTIVYFQGDLGGCNSGPRIPAVAIFSEVIGKPIVRDTMICSGNSVTLTAKSNIPGAQIRWWDVPSGGNLLAITNSFNTPPLNADRTYYVDVDLGSYCAFLSRTPIVVDVRDILAAPIPRCSDIPDEITTDKVTFVWDIIPGAVRYEVSDNGGSTWISSNRGNKHEFTGMMPGSARSLNVRAHGLKDCETSLSNSFNCSTIPCPLIEFEINVETAICLGEQVNVNITGLNGVTYNYAVVVRTNPASTQTSYQFTPSQSGDFVVGVTVKNVDDNDCNVLYKEKTVIVYPLPVVNFDYVSNIDVTPGALINEFQFYDNTTGAASWFWEFGDGQTSTEQNPKHTYIAPADDREEFYDIKLTVTSDKGCEATVEKFDDVRVYVVPTIYIPTGFCPTCGDDNFRPWGEGFELESFKIFNQWGNLVHDVSNVSSLADAGWNGRYNGVDQPIGTYVYTAVFKILSTGEQVIKQGTVTLIK